MKYVAILCCAILCYCNSSTAQTVPVTNIQEQIRNANDAVLGLTSNDPNFYTFNELPSTLQGVIIQLAPREIKRVFLQSNNCRLQFANPVPVTSFEINFDNAGFQTTTFTSGATNIGWITPPASFMTVGEHNLKVKFLPSAASTFLFREYRISVTAASSKLFIDNTQALRNNGSPLTTGNVITLWDNPNCSNAEPLLLSEGFDATNVQFPESYRFRGNALINNLFTLGYKVYILNYNLANQDMKSNAAVYSSAIKFISQINNNRDVFAAGISMGGIITRFALAKAESQNTPLPVSAYLSLDAPHQGAVVDAIFQSFVNDLSPDLAATKSLAAKQLLNNHVLEPNHDSNIAFFNELKSLNGDGYPHIVPTIGAAFSKNAPNSNASQKWLTMEVTVLGGAVGKHGQFFVLNDWAQAGSFLPLESTNIESTVPLWGVATVNRLTHPTFIPHNSALDKINGISKFNTTLIPLEPGNDFFHDEIPPSISNGIFNLFNTDITTIASNETFNFTALKGSQIRKNLSVLGTLGINKNLPSGSSLATIPESKFNQTLQKLFTTPCSPITINVDGKVDIGDVGANSAVFNASLTLKTGDVLRIKPNATLQLNQGSQLIIGNGAKLIIDGNANVNLMTTLSSIVVQNGGEIIVNGQFNFTGSGFFSFEQGNKFTLNSNLTLSGAGRNVKLISIGNGATLEILANNLTIQNATVRKEAGTVSSARYIWLRNGATFSANNVSFDNAFSTFSPATFIEIQDPIDLTNDPDDVDYGFQNCSFNSVRTAVKFFVTTASSDPFDWQNVNAEFRNCQFTQCTALDAQRGYLMLFDQCFLNGCDIKAEKIYWLNLSRTTMLGGGLSLGIRARYVGHFWVRDNCLIDQYGTGIDASIGWNWNIIMTDNTTIQRCNIGILLNGTVYNSTTDLGLMHMDCARLIENNVGIKGTDIIFSAYTRWNVNGETANVFRKSGNPGAQYIQSIFQNRQDTELWLHGNYWDGISPATTPINTEWSFQRKSLIPQVTTLTPWAGTFFLAPIRTSATDAAVVNCGGVMLRGEREDPLEKNTVVKVDGVLRDIKKQQDAGWRKLKEKKLEEAVDIMRPIAEISSDVRASASTTVQHFIDVSRAFNLKSNDKTKGRSAKSGWLPETKVLVDNIIQDDKILLYPNPTTDKIQLSLEFGDYTVKIFDALGKAIKTFDTEGEAPVAVNDWQAGIYLIEILNKTTNKKLHGKVVVQH
jgi:hypothetical protein